MNNKALFFILFIFVSATIIWQLMDNFNKRLNIQEEKVNKLTEDRGVCGPSLKQKIGFITD